MTALAKIGTDSGYPVYSIGQEVTVGGESFYVLEASDSTQSTVTLLAKYNLNLAGTAQAPNASYEDTKSVFSSTNYWASAYSKYTDWSIKKLDINTVSGEVAGDAIYKAKAYATAKGGTNGRLLTYEETDALKTSYGDMIWGKANQQGTGSSNYYLFYWLSSSNDSNNNGVFLVEGSAEGTDWGFCDNGSYNGVRPVVTVPKSKVDIEELNKYFAAGPDAYCDDENGTFRNVSGINIDCSKIEDVGDSSDGWIFKYNNNYYILNIIDEPWSATVSLYNI